MKIIYAGAFHEKSTNYSQARELSKLCDLITYEYRIVADRIGLEARDKHLIEFVKSEKADLLLIAKGKALGIEVVHECNKIAKTALWFMDAVGPHWNKDLIEKVKHCNYVFCDKLKAVELGKELNPKTHHICEGFDPECDFPHKVDYTMDVSFIGGVYGDRMSIINATNSSQISNAFGKDHSLAVSSSRINLNKCTSNDASDRVYKIMAAKGFLLTDDWYGRNKMFEDGKHLVIYNSIKDLQDKVEYYLEDSKKRNKIALEGYKEVQKYSRTNWAKYIIDITS